jgi:hypothetical protein
MHNQRQWEIMRARGKINGRVTEDLILGRNEGAATDLAEGKLEVAETLHLYFRLQPPAAAPLDVIALDPMMRLLIGYF